MKQRIRRQFSLVTHSPDVAELRYGVWNSVSFNLRDDAKSGHLAKLLMRLDGTSSLQEIAKEEGIAIDEVNRVVSNLEELGVLESEARNVVDYALEHIPGSGGDPVDLAAAATPLDIIGDTELASALARLVAATLPKASITIHGPTSPLSAALGNAALSSKEDGLRFHEANEPFTDLRGRFVIFISNIIDPIRLKRLNRACFQQGTPWLHAALDGPFVFVGPVTIPGRSACFECFETRVTLNLRESASYQEYKKAIVKHAIRYGEIPARPLLEALLLAHSAVEAVSFMVTGHTCTVNKALSIYVPTMEFAYHDILRVPNCEACSLQRGAASRETYFDVAAVSQPTDT